jgi:hypothetical protein
MHGVDGDVALLRKDVCCACSLGYYREIPGVPVWKGPRVGQRAPGNEIRSSATVQAAWRLSHETIT